MKKLLPFSFILIILIFISCKKNEEVDMNPNIKSSNDVLLSESMFQNIFVMLVKARCDSSVMAGEDVMISNALVRYSCDQKKFSFIYGYVLCPDSVKRCGMIYIFTDGDILTPGTTARVVFDNYNEDDNKINADDSIVTVSHSGECIFRMKTDNVNIEKALNSGTIRCSSLTMISVKNNPDDPGNKIIKFSGNNEGISASGYNYSSVSDSITWSTGCPWAFSGITTVKVPSGQIQSSVIDCADSDSCNNIFYYHIDNTTMRVRKLNRYLL